MSDQARPDRSQPAGESGRVERTAAGANAGVRNSSLRAALEALPSAFCLHDADDRLVFCNRRYREVYPQDADAMPIGRRFEDLMRERLARGEYAEAVGREEEWIAERMRCHANPQGPIEQKLANGRWLRIDERRTAEGETISLGTDVTDLNLMEQALKLNDERFRDFIEASADWVWEMDADLRFTFLSENVERILGVSRSYIYGRSRRDLLGDDYDHELWERHEEVLRNRQPFRNFEYQPVAAGIKPPWLRLSGKPIFAEDGSFRGYLGTATNITDQKTAEANLRASEVKLMHAQKAESIGRLTAGIAHDFNNLLEVIQGNLELLGEELADPQSKEMVEAALRSVSRGAELTGQLLMFGRRALLAPEVIDLNRNVTAMGELIRRKVPASIELEIRWAPNLWPAKLDQSQLEAAFLNIVISAKDAMPEGGRLTIWTENATLTEKELGPFSDGVEPGRYVVIGAADTGHGMDPATSARAFEPFFTTKEVGQETGLGLSMVQGFVHHSKGDVLIESSPGQGTTVRLYFPACDQPAPAEPAKADSPAPHAHPGDCLLVVEDQADVRKVVAAKIETLGYEVLQAVDGASALEVLRSDTRIDAMLSDVVMPGTPQGPGLVEAARELRPGIGVLLMTGYPSKTAGERIWSSPSCVCLTKPVSIGSCLFSVLVKLRAFSAMRCFGRCLGRRAVR